MGLKKRTESQVIRLATPAPGLNTVWRAPYNCDVVRVSSLRVAGTTATVNAHRERAGSNAPILAAAQTAGTTWATTETVTAANAAFNAGDGLVLECVAATGSPTMLVIQVDLVVDADQ